MLDYLIAKMLANRELHARVVQMSSSKIIGIGWYFSLPADISFAVFCTVALCLRPIGRRHYAILLSDVCQILSVAYIGRNSRTKRPRKTKIGIEVYHVTRNSDTTFKVKRSKVNLLLMS